MGDTTVERFSGDEPHFKEALRSLEGRASLTCQPCGSEDTEVVHHAGAGSIIGSWHEIEVRCRACGRYSAEVTEYES